MRHLRVSAGAATTDIIQQYVSTIKALQHIDPSGGGRSCWSWGLAFGLLTVQRIGTLAGVILDAVGDPIREYLRSRKDTIRCIVTMLTDDGEDAAAESLFAELGNTEQAAEVRFELSLVRGCRGSCCRLPAVTRQSACWLAGSRQRF